MEQKVSSHQVSFSMNSFSSNQKVALVPPRLSLNTVLYRIPFPAASPAYSNLYIEVSLQICEELVCLEDTLQEMQVLFNCHLSCLKAI